MKKKILKPVAICLVIMIIICIPTILYNHYHYHYYTIHEVVNEKESFSIDDIRCTISHEAIYIAPYSQVQVTFYVDKVSYKKFNDKYKIKSIEVNEKRVNKLKLYYCEEEEGLKIYFIPNENEITLFDNIVKLVLINKNDNTECETEYARDVM